MANGIVYGLIGSKMFPQVEPGSAQWPRAAVPRAIQLEEVRRELEGVLIEYDDPNSAAEQADLAKVQALTTHVDDPAFFKSNETLSPFLSDPRYVLQPLPVGSTKASPTPIYPPPGAVYNRRNPIISSDGTSSPFLRTGAELARLFESETPGLWHRHVLNIVFDQTIPGGAGQRYSAPRQALVWAALDTAISSALQVAWYLKWNAFNGRQVSYRRRPWQADQSLQVLFDYKIAYDNVGNIVRGSLRDDPPGTGHVSMTAGTPRHPSYPSGHSTFSAAASTVLGCLLPEHRAAFDQLANNIGRARLWAGVHWFKDHEFGQAVGKLVGKLVVAQLNASGIARDPAAHIDPLDEDELRKEEEAFYDRAKAGQDFCRGLGPRPGSPSLMNFPPEFDDPAGATPPA